jgi:hypothetical protein
MNPTKNLIEPKPYMNPTKNLIELFLKLVQNYTILFSETIMFAQVLLMT